jgi:hypothetical protein
MVSMIFVCVESVVPVWLGADAIIRDDVIAEVHE